MFQTKVVDESKHTLYVQQSFLLLFEIRAVYEIMWANNVEPDRTQMTIWRMRIACWIPEATKTHSEYVILNAFPLRQWLQELAPVLRYTCIGCFVDTRK